LTEVAMKHPRWANQFNEIEENSYQQIRIRIDPVFRRRGDAGF